MEGQVGVACSLGESEEAGGVGEQRHREGQWGMLPGRWRTDAHRDQPLRTTLTVSLAAQPFKDQVVLVTFKVLQSLDKKRCGLKRDEGWVLDSDLPVSAASLSLEHFISPAHWGTTAHLNDHPLQSILLPTYLPHRND